MRDVRYNTGPFLVTMTEITFLSLPHTLLLLSHSLLLSLTLSTPLSSSLTLLSLSLFLLPLSHSLPSSLNMFRPKSVMFPQTGSRYFIANTIQPKVHKALSFFKMNISNKNNIIDHHQVFLS